MELRSTTCRKLSLCVGFLKETHASMVDFVCVDVGAHVVCLEYFEKFPDLFQIR